MMINFCTAGDIKQEPHDTFKCTHTSAYGLTHTFTDAYTDRHSAVSSQGSTSTTLAYVFYHSVFDPTFLLCVSTLLPGQFKWPGAASSKYLTQQPSSHCVLTSTAIICHKLFCFFTLPGLKTLIQLSNFFFHTICRWL